MKKLIFLFLACAALTSCKTGQNFYQVYDIKPVNMQTTTDAIVYYDNDCTISYNLWDNNGYLTFMFENKTDEELYICMPECFYISNNVAYDYYNGRTNSNSVGVVRTATATTTGTALGYWASGTKWVPGSVSASSTVGETASASRTVTYKEKKYIAIPPKAAKVISGFKLVNAYQITCEPGFNNYPSKNPTTYEFTMANTPLRVKNHIAYSKEKSDKNLKIIENEFWLNTFTNYSERNFKRTSFEENCTGDLENITTFLCKPTPTRCYNVRYHGSTRANKVKSKKPLLGKSKKASDDIYM